MSEAAIETTGIILERKGEILYRVELMNGKVVLGHLSKPLTDAKVVQILQSKHGQPALAIQARVLRREHPPLD